MNGTELIVGVVGYGYWGPNLLRNFAECPSARVKWLIDQDPSRQALAKSRWPSVIVDGDIDTMLADPDVDAVVLATPIGTHRDLGLRVMEAGKHLFVEKPLASSSSDAEDLVRYAEAKRLTLMVGHTFEYSPPVVKTKELIDAGELGDIYFICSSRVNLGLHQKDVSVIWDLAPHDFSILFYWLGEGPDHVSAFGRSCVYSANPDVAFINLGFPSGAVAEVQVSWLSPVKLRRTMIVGSKKMLLYDDTESVEKVKLFDHGVQLDAPESFGEYQLSYRTGDIVSPRLETTEPLMNEVKHFVECVATGSRPRSDGFNGLRVVQALERADDWLSAERLANVPAQPTVWSPEFAAARAMARPTFSDGGIH